MVVTTTNVNLQVHVCIFLCVCVIFDPPPLLCDFVCACASVRRYCFIWQCLCDVSVWVWACLSELGCVFVLVHDCACVPAMPFGCVVDRVCVSMSVCRRVFCSVPLCVRAYTTVVVCLSVLAVLDCVCQCVFVCAWLCVSAVFCVHVGFCLGVFTRLSLGMYVCVCVCMCVGGNVCACMWLCFFIKAFACVCVCCCVLYSWLHPFGIECGKIWILVCSCASVHACFPSPDLRGLVIMIIFYWIRHAHTDSQRLDVNSRNRIKQILVTRGICISWDKYELLWNYWNIIVWGFVIFSTALTFQRCNNWNCIFVTICRFLL